MEGGIEVALKANVLGEVWGIPITNALVMTWIAMALIFIFVFIVRRRMSLVPGKLQAGLELAVEGGLSYTKETLENDKLAERFFPLIAGLAVFIATINELEFFPGVGSIGFFHEGGEFVPLLRASTTDLNTTLALTLISVLTVEVMGVISLGFFRYAGKFISFKSPVKFVVGLIELVSEISRLVTFSFRLFGNIFAGEVLIAIVAFFVPYILPAPFMLFEMFVGIVQGVIFALLTLFFLKLAIMPGEGH